MEKYLNHKKSKDTLQRSSFDDVPNLKMDVNGINDLYVMRKQFSLIELLVVISIFAVLTSLLSPSLRKTIQYGNQISCAKKMKSVHLAITLYGEDHSGYFPVTSQEVWAGGPLKEKSITWDDRLGMGYDGRSGTEDDSNQNMVAEDSSLATESYLCPTQEVYGSLSWASTSAIRRSYSLTDIHFNANGQQNAWGLSGRSTPWSYNDPISIRADQIVFSSEKTIIMFENTQKQFLGNLNLSTSTGYNLYGANAIPHEEGNSNYLFVDGHVSFLWYFDTLAYIDGSTGSIDQKSYNHRGTAWQASEL
jgi:prepilin-type processing-associated H-X9-DG protein/prepilin-type N-terminal cleavage/methylation domain-containing protein